jgi:hypothetical protein
MGSLESMNGGPLNEFGTAAAHQIVSNEITHQIVSNEITNVVVTLLISSVAPPGGPTAVTSVNGPYFGMIPLWAARLNLTGRELRALSAIASRLGKPRSEPSPDGVIETRIARVGSQCLADETNIHRRHLHTVIRQLEAKAKGLFQVVRHGGGRARGSQRGDLTGQVAEYRVVFRRGANATNCTEDGALNTAETAPSPGPILHHPRDVNCTVHGARTEEETDSDPPSGGDARARGEFFSG